MTKWLSVSEAAEILSRTGARIRQYVYEERWGLVVKPREKNDRIWLSEESVYRLKRELEENTAGRPKVKMASKALRHLQYAKRAIEAIPLAPRYQEPILALIDKFLQPELDAWIREKEEPGKRSEPSEPQSNNPEPAPPAQPNSKPTQPAQPSSKPESNVRILDFTGED